ncbi:MmcB family DNA repair protein, partial [Klebsiella pneumoniae]
MKEYEVKIKLTEYLLANIKKNIIGSEFRFDFGARRADIITICDGIATAFEIKTSGDNVTRLPQQIYGYKKYFDFCFIVCEPGNIDNVRKVISKEIGLIMVDDMQVTLIRKSKQFKAHDKLILASTLNIKEIRSLVKIGKLSKMELCQKISETFNLKKIRSISRYSLEKRMKAPFETFINEKGDSITRDDLMTLNRMPSHRSVSYTHL